MMVNVYLDKCLYSPFEFPELSKKMLKSNIKIVKSAAQANVIMSSYLPVLKKYLHLVGKRFIIWTHEPYHDWTQEKKIKVKDKTISIMNCYTENVYMHNYRYFYFKTPLSLLLKTDDTSKVKVNICVLSTYYNESYYEKNPKSILEVRYNLIMCGYSRGILDIYGQGWEKCPNVKTCGNSRKDKDKRQSKAEILSNYNFNLCLENAKAPYYITEKIWESIKYGCLPIYASSSTIYETFPKNSFIDYDDYNDVNKLYDVLENMTIQEYNERMNLCITAFNNVIKNKNHNQWRGTSKNLNINFIEYESCTKQLIKELTK